MLHSMASIRRVDAVIMKQQEDAHRESVERSSAEPGDDPGGGSGRDPELLESQRFDRERAEIERRMLELEEPERTLLRLEMEERVLELQEIEEAERQRLVREALGKFGVFMHLTAFVTGVAYLVLLAVFAPETLPWIFIPIGLWTIGIGYHFWRAWHPKDPEDEAIKSLDDQVEPEGGRWRRVRKRLRRNR
jgi:hypothetical protein